MKQDIKNAKVGEANESACGTKDAAACGTKIGSNQNQNFSNNLKGTPQASAEERNTSSYRPLDEEDDEDELQEMSQKSGTMNKQGRPDVQDHKTQRSWQHDETMIPAKSGNTRK